LNQVSLHESRALAKFRSRNVQNYLLYYDIQWLEGFCFDLILGTFVLVN